MTRAWVEGPEEPSYKLVFLAICDHANDDGVCWPSMARIAKKCCLSDRQTRRIVRILEKRGNLLTQQSEGHSSNRYLVQFPTRTPMTELDDKEPGHTGPTTRTPMTGDPDIAMSDKSSLTVNRTIICKEANSKPKKERPRDALLDSLASLGGSNPKETPRSRWSSIAKCKRDLLEVCPDLSPQEIDRRAENYRTHFSGAALTPEALTKHWAVCATRNTRPKQSLGLPTPHVPAIRFS